MECLRLRIRPPSAQCAGWAQIGSLWTDNSRGRSMPVYRLVWCFAPTLLFSLVCAGAEEAPQGARQHARGVTAPGRFSLGSLGNTKNTRIEARADLATARQFPPHLTNPSGQVSLSAQSTGRSPVILASQPELPPPPPDSEGIPTPALVEGESAILNDEAPVISDFAVGDESLPSLDSTGFDPPAHSMEIERGDAVLDSGVLLPEGDYSGITRLESSQSLIRRRTWYIEQDVTILERGRPREATISTKQRGSNTFDATLNIPFREFQSLGASSAQLRSAPGAHITLGRHLFTDNLNRDWELEFTYWGLFEWEGVHKIRANPGLINISNNGLRANISELIFVSQDDIMPGFNYAISHTSNYRSNLNSFELNTKVLQRPGSDRLVLSPNGVWTREMDSNLYYSFLGGLRFLRQYEDFSLVSIGDQLTNQVVDRHGRYIVQSFNDLVGLQIGGDVTYEHAWWSLGARGKLGTYVNYAQQHSRVIIRDGLAGTNIVLADGERLPVAPADRDELAKDETLAMTGELQISATARLRQNIRLRSAFDLLWVQGLALAPEQVNFQNDRVPVVKISGFNVNPGVSLGFEMNW